MFILTSIIIIALISIGMSVWTLKNMQKGLKTHETAQHLKKGRVIFHASSVSSSKDS